MLRINIVNEQGELLGTAVLNYEDKDQHGELDARWVGEKILDELPSDPAALNKLLD